MSWATEYIEKLKKGETVQFNPVGKSMKGYIESGQLVQVSPIRSATVINVGDIVLCKVKKNHYLHFVKNKRITGMYQIGNANGYINGWIDKENIYGKLDWVQDDCTQCDGRHLPGDGCPFV